LFADDPEAAIGSAGAERSTDAFLAGKEGDQRGGCDDHGGRAGGSVGAGACAETAAVALRVSAAGVLGLIPWFLTCVIVGLAFKWSSGYPYFFSK
jgi:hypothetical protein